MYVRVTASQRCEPFFEKCVLLKRICISDDDEVDSFIGQSANSAAFDEDEVLQSYDNISVDESFSTATNLTSSGQLHFLSLTTRYTLYLISLILE